MKSDLAVRPDFVPVVGALINETTAPELLHAP